LGGRRNKKGKLIGIELKFDSELIIFSFFMVFALGMQCAVIEYARNVCGWKDAK